MIARRVVLGGIAGAFAWPSVARERWLHRDDFRAGLADWVIEAERPAVVTTVSGVLDIDAPAGLTLWFRRLLRAPVAIEYDVTAVARGGANDAVSDVNCFWMATDPRAAVGDVLARRRSGAFADYDELTTYYAGIGGNRNSTTRFRRYVGRRGVRPLLPEHDLSAPGDLLEPNRRYHLRLIADVRRVALQRDGRTLFAYDDPAPYTRGHFGLRTTQSHLRVENFRVSRLG